MREGSILARRKEAGAIQAARRSKDVISKIGLNSWEVVGRKAIPSLTEQVSFSVRGGGSERRKISKIGCEEKKIRNARNGNY